MANTDTQATTTPAATASEGTEAPKQKRTRTIPVFDGFVDEIPPQRRNSHWDDIVDTLAQNPGRPAKFPNQSTNTAAYLNKRYRKSHGLKAMTRDSKGNKATVYLVVDPALKGTEFEPTKKAPRGSKQGTQNGGQNAGPSTDKGKATSKS